MADGGYEYLVAVDGGGSGCRAGVADPEGRLLGRGEAGPANVTTDPAQATVHIRQAIQAAWTDAGRVPSDRVKAHFGLAGALTAGVQRQIAQGVGLSGAVVSDDLDTMATGALGGGKGILAAVGTGSVLAAVRPEGVRRIGGWGLSVSDQASGAWLGRALLEQALLCHDGLAEHSGLTRSIVEDMNGALGIVDFAARAQPANYATLAPRIVAAKGDPVAEGLLRKGADYLAQGIAVLGWHPGRPLCLCGGLGPVYAARLSEPMQAECVAPKGTALDGALLLAGRQGEGA